jgi:hypothetical protein
VDGGSRAGLQRATARARGDAARGGGPARGHAGHPCAETDWRAPPRRRLEKTVSDILNQAFDPSYLGGPI